MKAKISFVILSYNRKDRLINIFGNLKYIKYQPIEIIIVDNGSDDPIDEIVKCDGRAVLIKNEKNLGAVGRNRGIEAASGDIIVTLDDDVYGITDTHLESILQIMEDSEIAAINFKIIDESTRHISDWCHPCDPSIYSEIEFETNDISEGAVAFKHSALIDVGLYPEYFFISHEGPDLACRLINRKWRVVYSPKIVVTHAYDMRARVSWRRYYFDTRNLLWLVLRNFAFGDGIKRIIIGWGAMLVYSLRDGYIYYWLIAVFDALRGASRAWKDRIPVNCQARLRLRRINKNKIGFWKMVRNRFHNKEVRI